MITVCTHHHTFTATNRVHMMQIEENKIIKGFPVGEQSRLLSFARKGRLKELFSFWLSRLFFTMMWIVAKSANRSAVMSITKTLDQPVGTISPVRKGPSAAPGRWVGVEKHYAEEDRGQEVTQRSGAVDDRGDGGQGARVVLLGLAAEIGTDSGRDQRVRAIDEQAAQQQQN